MKNSILITSAILSCAFMGCSKSGSSNNEITPDTKSLNEAIVGEWKTKCANKNGTSSISVKSYDGNDVAKVYQMHFDQNNCVGTYHINTVTSYQATIKSQAQLAKGTVALETDLALLHYGQIQSMSSEVTVGNDRLRERCVKASVKNGDSLKSADEECLQSPVVFYYRVK